MHHPQLRLVHLADHLLWQRVRVSKLLRCRQGMRDTDLRRFLHLASELRDLHYPDSLSEQRVRLPHRMYGWKAVRNADLWRGLPQRCQLWHVRLGLILQRQHLSDLPHDLLRRQDVRRRGWTERMP